MSKFTQSYEQALTEAMGASEYYLKNLKNSITFLIGQMDFDGSIKEFKDQIKNDFGIKGFELFSDEELEGLMSKSRN